MAVVYGIKNCDTVKKACKWLDQHDIEFTFHDFRKDGLTKSKVQSWLKEIDWETLVNKRGTTWRKLNDTQKSQINKTSATKLMVEQPTLIKRPVLEIGTQVFVGFSPENYQSVFSNHG